jgi:S-adenosylmethionine decarboxylase
MAEHFGEHLTIDGYGGDRNSLNDKNLIVRFINNLMADLEMHPLGELEIVQAPDNGQKDPGGWSAFQMIMESHISIHTFPNRQFISADVYTCKNGLDQEFIKQQFKDTFRLQELETNFIKRGLNYPEQNIHPDEELAQAE